MPTTLDSDGIRLFEYLLSIAPAVNPEAGEGFITYLAAHKALGLSKGGFTWGDSLDRQGMGNVAHWARDNGYPAITGFIVSEESMMPAKGFFRFYGKDPDSDFAWWLSEVKAAKAFKWLGTAGTSASSSFVDAPRESDDPRRGARFVSDIVTPESRFFLKSEWGPISAYWPALSFSKRSVGDYLNGNYNPAKDFIVFAGTSDPNRTEVPEHRQALLSILITEPGTPLATSELVPWESWQEQLEKHGKNWPFSFGVRAGWNLTELPSARSLTPAAYRALGIRSNWGGVSEITSDEKQALYSQPIEWVTLPNRGVVNAASAKRDRIRDMRENPSLNSALVRLQDLIRNRLGPPQSVRVTRPGRHLPPGQDLLTVLYDKLIEQNYLCALCGKLMRLDTQKKLLQISPDRKDSSNPSYGSDNLQITHLACNLAKNDCTTEDFEEWLQTISAE